MTAAAEVSAPVGGAGAAVGGPSEGMALRLEEVGRSASNRQSPRMGVPLVHQMSPAAWVRFCSISGVWRWLSTP